MSTVMSWIFGSALPIVTLDPTTNAYPAGHHLGNPGGLSAVDTDLVAGYIAAGITIFGVTGNYMYWDRIIQAAISQSHALAIVVPSQVISKNAPLATVLKYAYTDDPADLIKRLTTPVASTKALTVIAAADQSIANNVAFHRFFDLQIVVGGAEAEAPITIFVDETSAAQDDVANDMTLLPAVPAIGCAYYFGFDQMFDAVALNVGTAGIGNWTIEWQYWNGAAWTALAGVTDGTTSFQVAGLHDVSFTRPVADWATVAVNGVTKYWVRAEVTGYVGITTQPLGTQAWIKIITYS